MVKEPDSRNPSQAEIELRQKYGLDLQTLRRMYEDWDERGVPKSVVEARYLRTRRHHGKLFSKLVRDYLGIETEHPHPLRERIAELEQEVARLNDEIARLQDRIANLTEPENGT